MLVRFCHLCVHLDVCIYEYLSQKYLSPKPVLQICAFTSMTVVIISTLTFVLSTMPELAEEIDVVLFDNETESGDVAQERCLCICLCNLMSLILVIILRCYAQMGNWYPRTEDC